MKSIQEFLQQISKTKKLEEQIEIYQKAVDLFQMQENEMNILDQKNQEIYDKIEKYKNLEESADLSELVQIKNRIQKEIERFGNVAANEDAPNQASVIKQRRETSLSEFLKNIKDKSIKTFSNVSEINGISTQAGVVITVSTASIAIVSVILFLVEFNLLYLVSGIVFFLANLVILSIAKSQHISKFEIEEEYTSYEDFVTKLDKKENEFLLNVAWVNALKREQVRVNESLNKFGNVQTSISLEEKNLLIKNNQRINEILNSSIQPLEYFKIKDKLIELQLEQLDGMEEGQEIPTVPHISINVPSLSGLDEILRLTIMEYIEYLKGFYTVKFEENA